MVVGHMSSIRHEVLDFTFYTTLYETDFTHTSQHLTSLSLSHCTRRILCAISTLILSFSLSLADNEQHKMAKPCATVLHGVELAVKRDHVLKQLTFLFLNSNLNYGDKMVIADAVQSAPLATALHMYSSNPGLKPKILQMIQELRFDVNQTNAFCSNSTPLALALISLHYTDGVDVVTALLENGATDTINKIGCKIGTPLDILHSVMSGFKRGVSLGELWKLEIRLFSLGARSHVAL